MTLRIAFLSFVLLAVPCNVHAAGYLVRSGDSLALIAQRYHVSVGTLARVNGIRNPNLVQAGRYLVIPGRIQRARPLRYRVRWGDTLSAIAVRYHVSIRTLRALNPRLGAYLLAGSWLTLCSGCSGRGGASTYVHQSTSVGRYVVRPGDTLSGIAARYGVSTSSLMSSNRIANPDRVIIGTALSIPGASTGGYVSAAGTGIYDPWSARATIQRYAAWYGLEASLPLAVGYEESGFNQTAVSRTGAIGVMQVEPYTASHIAQLLGRSLNIYSLDDNVHAGVYWLAVLVHYYSGDERLAVAAYYEGTRALARHGMYADTVQYVANVMALKARFGG